MTKKRENAEVEVTANKKQKTQKTDNEAKSSKQDFAKKNSFSKKTKSGNGDFKNKSKPFEEKPEDWNEYKKKKKELKLKRKQGKSGFDVIVKAKKIGEKLRCKNLKGGPTQRNALINELHSLLKGKDHYPKFVLAHDTSRVVQWLLKYSSDHVKNQISEELVPVTLTMIQSKYGIFCVKRLLKYGNNDIKSSVVNKMYGHAVKLSTHVLSAPVFEYAYSNCASTQQKQHLVQEFYGEIYKNSKDNQIKHLRDVFLQSPDLKTATLGAIKSNLTKILDKNLLDSGLVQTVINQYIGECSNEDKNELISQLVSHIVVLSNSKDGARAAMQCIWHGTNKDRKVAMKTIKEHVLEMSKHEHAHCTIVTLLDTADDTVLLHKIILGEILKSARELAENEWGRKVLLWLVAPADSTCFHPVFVKELEEGRKNSNSKKEADTRRQEILGYSIETLLKLLTDEPEFWLKNSSLAYEMLAIVKAGTGPQLVLALQSIVNVIVKPDWKIKLKDREIAGVEDAGIHMVLKKLAKQDNGFNSCLVDSLTEEIVGNWLNLNRGCFLLIAVFENGGADVQKRLKSLLQTHHKGLKTQSSAGGKILLKKLSN